MIKQHFEGCPYGCNSSGKILDTSTGNMVDCPHCSKLKKELIAKGQAIEEENNTVLPLSEILGIKSKYLSKNYISDTIIPEDEKLFIEDNSIDYLKKETEDMYHQLSIGELPTNSYCFGISIKGRVDRLAYPLLAKAYLSGLSVGKFITCGNFASLQLHCDDLVDELYNADLVLMLLEEGSTKGELSSAKVLMQTRALKGKPTIFITTWTIEACSLLLGYSTDSENLFLAKPVFVKYKNSGKSSTYINKLTGVENSRYEENPVGYSLSDL